MPTESRDRLHEHASSEQRLHSKLAEVLSPTGCAGDMEDTGTCLSEDQILEFIEGQLPARSVRGLDAHLNRCGECSRLLVETLRAMHDETCPGDSAPTLTSVFAPGTVLAERYQVMRLVGRGGMGEVYEARDLATDERVALKTVLASRCDHPDLRSRFCGEARVAQSIRHPNVCGVLDVGVQDVASGERLHFLTMPFLQGPTLGRRIRDGGPLPLEEALSVARDVLLGLREAHALGVVHLDVKSDNVMLVGEAAEARAVIIDFGLARRLHGRCTLSACRSLSGTISYMAPEQLLGLPRGPFTDIFAFGVVLFEALTGEHPLLAHHVSTHSAVARIAQLPLRVSRALPGIPSAVDDFIMRCTRLLPEERYADGGQALEALAAIAVAAGFRGGPALTAGSNGAGDHGF